MRVRERYTPENSSTRQGKRLPRDPRVREAITEIYRGSLGGPLQNLLLFPAFLVHKESSLHYMDKKADQGNYVTGPRSPSWYG